MWGISVPFFGTQDNIAHVFGNIPVRIKVKLLNSSFSKAKAFGATSNLLWHSKYLVQQVALSLNLISTPPPIIN